MIHARVRESVNDSYGRWVPTGMVTIADAKEYMRTYLNLYVRCDQPTVVGYQPTVVEYMQL